MTASRRDEIERQRAEVSNAKLLLWAIVMEAGGRLEVSGETIQSAHDSNSLITSTDHGKGVFVVEAS